jgi:hypothetical protein
MMINLLIEYLFDLRRGLLKQVGLLDQTIEKVQTLKEIALQKGKDIDSDEMFDLFVMGLEKEVQPPRPEPSDEGERAEKP